MDNDIVSMWGRQSERTLRRLRASGLISEREYQEEIEKLRTTAIPSQHLHRYQPPNPYDKVIWERDFNPVAKDILLLFQGMYFVPAVTRSDPYELTSNIIYFLKTRGRTESPRPPQPDMRINYYPSEDYVTMEESIQELQNAFKKVAQSMQEVAEKIRNSFTRK